MGTISKASLAGVVLALGLTSCSSDLRLKPTVDVTIRNASTNHLDWVEVNWGGRSMEAGVLIPGTGKTILDAGLPAGVTTNMALIEFIDEDNSRLNWESGSNEEVRARRKQSETRVPVDVTRLLHLSPGHYNVTFRVLSLTNADVVVEKKARR